MRTLVHGFAIAGEATVRALLKFGHHVVVTDDNIDDQKERTATSLGLSLRSLPPEGELPAFLSAFDLVVPAPGVPEYHALITTAQNLGVRLASEIELAYEWEQQRPGGPRPILAVTGTDGKTTTCEMAVSMLTAAGVRSIAAGNTDVPLVEAIDLDVDVYVVECTSFRLAWTDSFRPRAAVWLNLAPDHLNWHRSMESYEAAKARLFRFQTPADVAIGNCDDTIVSRHLESSNARTVTFGRGGAYHLDGEWLCGPCGKIISTSEMPRALPHDIDDALAAAALVIESGHATASDVAHALRTFSAPPHRLEWVAAVNGVDFYNDSKATTPHAASAAIRAFPQAVLIAGGRNKDLDLSPMSAAGRELRAVVAIGEAAGEISSVFEGVTEVVSAGSMEGAVEIAARLARGEGQVVLSPGCASFDWYPTGGYPARGEHFARLVRDLSARVSLESTGGAR